MRFSAKKVEQKKRDRGTVVKKVQSFFLLFTFDLTLRYCRLHFNSVLLFTLKWSHLKTINRKISFYGICLNLVRI